MYLREHKPNMHTRTNVHCDLSGMYAYINQHSHPHTCALWFCMYLREHTPDIHTHTNVHGDLSGMYAYINQHSHPHTCALCFFCFHVCTLTQSQHSLPHKSALWFFIYLLQHKPNIRTHTNVHCDLSGMYTYKHQHSHPHKCALWFFKYSSSSRT